MVVIISGEDGRRDGSELNCICNFFLKNKANNNSEPTMTAI
jgi:hypothetical protein